MVIFARLRPGKIARSTHPHFRHFLPGIILLIFKRMVHIYPQELQGEIREVDS